MGDGPRRRRRGAGEAGRARGFLPGRVTLCEAGGEAEARRGGAGGALRLDRSSGHETGLRLVVDDAPARLREEVDARAPATRNAEQVADDRARLAGEIDTVRGKRRDGDLAQRVPARRGDHRVAAQHLDAAPSAILGERHRAVARVDDGGKRDAGIGERGRQLISAVIIGEDDGAAARPHAVAVDVALRRPGQHDAREIVVDEDERPLDRAGRQHDLARANFSQYLARRSRRSRARRQMVGHPLEHGDEVMVVIAGYRAARQEPDLRHRGELRQAVRQPIRGCTAIDLGAAEEELPAELALLVGDQDAGAGASSGKSGGDAGRAAAGDEHVDMIEPLLVAFGIGQGRRTAEPGGAPDEMLVGEPAPARPHEGLVVESRGNEIGEEIAGDAEIELHARPAIETGGGEPVMELDLRRLAVRVGIGTTAELDDRRWFLDAGRHDAWPS